jgi:hypothetical protein
VATRTISAAGGNYNDTATWDEGIVPTSADAVVVRADGTSGNVTVTAAAAALSLNLTAGDYNGTFTINSTFSLVVSGSVTLNSSGTCTGITGPGTLNINASASLTSNGKTIGGAFTWNPSGGTLTLVDDANVTGLLSWSGSSTPTIAGSGRTLNAAGGVNIANRAGISSGCTVRVTGGTCTGSITTVANYGITGAGTISFDGNITMTSLYIRSLANVAYISGTWGTGILNLGGNISLTGSPPINNVVYRSSGTLTLNASLSISGNLNAVSCTLTFAGAQAVSAAVLQVSSTGGVLNVGGCTLSAASMTIAASGTVSVLGASLSIPTVAIRESATLTFGAGYTLTVSTSFRVGGYPGALTTVKSSSAVSPFTLDLASATVESVGGIYTQVSVASPRTIYNAFGGTLTDVSRIENKNNTTMKGADPGVANVLSGVGYTVNGAALTGTLVAKSSSGG